MRRRNRDKETNWQDHKFKRNQTSRCVMSTPEYMDKQQKSRLDTKSSQARQCRPVILFRRQRQEDHTFEASLGNLASPYPCAWRYSSVVEHWALDPALALQKR